LLSFSSLPGRTFAHLQVVVVVPVIDVYDSQWRGFSPCRRQSVTTVPVARW
jgi:hypothetical protein